MSPLRRWVPLFTALTMALCGSLCDTSSASDEKLLPDGKDRLRTDLLGDPLPPGAIQRLGTTRLRHVDGVRSLTFSPDSKTLVSAGYDAIRAWDVATGKELPPFGKEGESAFSVAFFPDGKTLAAGKSAEIILWDVTRRQPASRLKEKNHEYRASLLAVSPDGETVAACESITIQLWQVSTGKLRGELQELDGAIKGLAFSPDGRSLVACSRPGVRDDVDNRNHVTLWELPGPKPKWQAKLSGGINSVSFFPDGKVVAVGRFTGAICYLSADTGEAVKAPDVNGRLVAVAPDGQMLAVVRSDPKTWSLVRNEPTVRLCDPVTGRERFCLKGHGSAVARLAFSPDGKVLASGSMDGTVILWDTATGRELHPLAGHRYRVGAVAFSPDGRSLITRGGDQTVRVWDLTSGKETLRLDAGSQEQDWVGVSWPGVNLAPSLACSADGQLVATWDYQQRSILVWDVRTGKQRCVLKGHLFWLRCVAFASDGKTLASTDRAGGVYLWDVAEGKLIRKLIEPPPEDRRRVTSLVAFSGDGKRLAVYSLDGLGVWDLPTATKLSATPGWASSLLFYHEGQKVAAATPNPGGERHAIRLIEATTGEVLRMLTWEDVIGSARLSLSLSPDGRFLASAEGTENGGPNQAHCGVRIWELLTGRSILLFRGHRGPVNGVAFSPDGTKLASASDDGTVLIWDLLALPKEREDLLGKGIDAALVDRLSSELADAEARQPFQAMAMLTRVPEKSVPLLRVRLRAIAEGLHQDVARLIADLDADEFAVREAASRSLRTRGTQVEPDLQRALAKASSLEARRRIQELLDQCRAGSAAPEVIWQERALTVLEWIASTEAKQVLQEIGRGEPKALLTRQAQAALRRLESRPVGP